MLCKVLTYQSLWGYHNHSLHILGHLLLGHLGHTHISWLHLDGLCMLLMSQADGIQVASTSYDSTMQPLQNRQLQQNLCHATSKKKARSSSPDSTGSSQSGATMFHKGRGTEKLQLLQWRPCQQWQTLQHWWHRL